jgi:hypothetical protein
MFLKGFWEKIKQKKRFPKKRFLKSVIFSFFGVLFKNISWIVKIAMFYHALSWLIAE